MSSKLVVMLAVALAPKQSLYSFLGGEISDEEEVDISLVKQEDRKLDIKNLMQKMNQVKGDVIKVPAHEWKKFCQYFDIQESYCSNFVRYVKTGTGKLFALVAGGLLLHVAATTIPERCYETCTNDQYLNLTIQNAAALYLILQGGASNLLKLAGSCL